MNSFLMETSSLFKIYSLYMHQMYDVEIYLSLVHVILVSTHKCYQATEFYIFCTQCSNCQKVRGVVDQGIVSVGSIF